MYNFHIFQFFELGNMYQLKKCCCCVDLRTGAILMAIVEIIGGLGMFGKSQLGWHDVLNNVFAIGAGVCLLFGAIKYHQAATLVYLVLQMIAIVLLVVAMLMMIIWATATAAAVSGNHGVQGNEGGVAMVIATAVMIYGIVASLHIYFWLCVFSFYKGLKTGEIAFPAYEIQILKRKPVLV